MKKKYFKQLLTTSIAIFCCFSVSLLAQVTQPEPRTLPYTQDFSKLALSYPNGMQGNVIGSGASSTYPTTDSTADNVIINGTASSNSGAIYNYNEKIGFLNSGKVNLGICLAIETLAKSGIIVQYDAMTIRNPGTKINEMVLQYRLGTTSAFTTLPETAYQNNSEVQTTSGETKPQNNKVIKVILPTECNNQAVVQIRWISKDVSGSGSRSSFAIDNIKIENDITAPVNVASYPKIENVLSNGFDLNGKMIAKPYETNGVKNSISLDVSQLRSGMYLYTLSQDNKVIYSDKFIKE